MKYQYFKNNCLEKAWILSSTKIFRNEELGFAEAVVQRRSVKKMFTVKYPCQSLFLIKFHTSGLQLYQKRDSDTGVLL